MNQEITALIVGIIAFFGAIIGVMVDRFIAYKKIFSETVSESRNKWINELRQNISIVLSEATIGQKKDTEEIYKSYNEVLLRLNLTEPLHLMLSYELKKLLKCTEDDFNEIQENIVLLSQQIHKTEWERVKKEARGGRNIK